jgi:uncharacterized protein YcnI
MTRQWMCRRTRVTAVGVLVAALIPVAVLAHAVVYPRSSAPGAYERYVLRVPNEKTAATTRVELEFPSAVRVISFADVPGWSVEAVTDSAGRIIRAVWTGTLPPQRFVELPFIAVNPTADTQLVWPAYQTYADGERVAWTGPEESQSPASVTTIGTPESGGGSRAAVWIAVIALVVGMAGLGLALRRQ